MRFFCRALYVFCPRLLLYENFHPLDLVVYLHLSVAGKPTNIIVELVFRTPTERRPHIPFHTNFLPNNTILY